jgi:hypothetical protein
MAYLVRRPGGSVQIRESVRTDRGPRSRTLAAFRGTLDERILETAARRAERPFDRAELIVKAREMGIAWASAANVAARRLVREIRVGHRLDATLASLLRENLPASTAEPEPHARPARAPDFAPDFEEVAEWLESSDEERGATLRGLLRLGDAIVRARGRPAARRDAPFPRIDSSSARGA